METSFASMTRGKAMLCVFMCALMWSTGGVLVKFIDMNPFAISGYRSLVALPVLLLFYPPKTLRFTLRMWLEALPLTVTGILFVLATKLTTAANAIVLQYSSPIFIILINRMFYKERARKSDIIVSLGCIAGIALFFLDELSPGNMLGNLLAIISGITSGAMFVIMNRTAEDRGTITVAVQIESIAICLPFMILFPVSFTLKTVAALLAFGVFQRALSIVLYAKASSYCSAMDAILISMAEPLCSPLLVLLFFGEAPGKFALIGGIVVISCVLLWNVVKIRSIAADGA